ALPELILVRVHDCQDTLVNEFPPGVIGTPAVNAQVKLKHFKYLPRASITVQQFAIVPAFSCTTEKLQGKTSPLERPGVPTRSEYVALSRTSALNKLTLTEEISPKYIANFKPPRETITKMQRLQKLIQVPPYITSEETLKFNEWKDKNCESVNEE
ncbi:hypothetical protein JG688_00017966, partial [Phytophthora aleatoria]